MKKHSQRLRSEFQLGYSDSYIQIKPRYLGRRDFKSAYLKGWKKGKAEVKFLRKRMKKAERRLKLANYLLKFRLFLRKWSYRLDKLNFFKTRAECRQ